MDAPPVLSISRCIHIVYRHKNVWEYQWSNFIYNCMSTFLHYVHYKDALIDCSAPGGERCESLTWVYEKSTKIDIVSLKSLFVFINQSLRSGRLSWRNMPKCLFWLELRFNPGDFVPICQSVIWLLAHTPFVKWPEPMLTLVKVQPKYKHFTKKNIVENAFDKYGSRLSVLQLGKDLISGELHSHMLLKSRH